MLQDATDLDIPLALDGVEQPKWGFNGLGYLVFARTYARPKPGGQESFEEAIQRKLIAYNKQLKCNFSSEELADIARRQRQFKMSDAGRFWWQLGTRTVNHLGLMSLQNCAATVINHPIRPFTWAMDALMLGCGVGYNLQREFVYELPKVQKGKWRAVRQDDSSADFIVPDTREGWVKLLGRVLKMAFYGGESFTYSTHCIRSQGAAISGFGGTASGPEVLVQGMEWIQDVLRARAGKKVRPVDCLDVMNIIGYIVVAGNVRRSAQIALGDYDDLDFLRAKRWDLGIPNWRAMSNNSVICNDISRLPEEFWRGYDGGGEPYGLINLALAKSTGRVGEPADPRNQAVIGFNPCSEQSLAAYETCCLAEIYLPNAESSEDLWQSVQYAYRINKHSLSLPCHLPETETVVHENYRMGIGMTGVLMASDEQRNWLQATYSRLKRFDSEYSYEHGFPTSVALTTVKPSGTLSLLPGVTPGIHPGFSRYFIRRVRIASNSPLVNKCRQSGYPVEPQRRFDGTEDRNTMVVSFPCMYPKGTVLASELTAIDQLEWVKFMQTVWSDNAVSCTIYYKQEELAEIREWLNTNYNSSVKSCSFLLHSGHGFLQAPYEEIQESQYMEMLAEITPLTELENTADSIELDECATGACPVK